MKKNVPKNGKPLVISLGGSLVYPNGGVDIDFVRKFVRMIEQHARHGRRFCIIVGGGAICREYVEAMRRVKKTIHATDLHWAGIAASRANATMLRGIFGSLAYPKVIRDPAQATARVFQKTPILIAGGEKPGQSTDTVAVRCAVALGASRVVNLSNVDHIYDRDPKQKGARPYLMLDWKNFRALLPSGHVPGAHTPFDAIAAREAERHGMELLFAGSNIKNIGHLIAGESFRGTVVLGTAPV